METQLEEDYCLQDQLHLHQGGGGGHRQLQRPQLRLDQVLRPKEGHQRPHHRHQRPQHHHLHQLPQKQHHHDLWLFKLLEPTTNTSHSL